MKKLIVLLILGVFLFSSCVDRNSKKPSVQCEFKVGQEVLMKPNDVKAIITYAWRCGEKRESYYVMYFDKFGKAQEINVKYFQIKKK